MTKKSFTRKVTKTDGPRLFIEVPKRFREEEDVTLKTVFTCTKEEQDEDEPHHTE